MKIRISADSTCDLSKELIEKYDISITPLTVVKEENEYKDGIDISPSDIFSHVDAGGSICTTTAVNVEDYLKIFKEAIKGYDAMIHISLGSDFSCSYQNACVAAEELGNIYIVDSQNLSSGQGLIVMEAAEHINDFANPKDLKEYLDSIVPKVEASFVLHRLDYMVKGGRCSSVAALGANILKLNPSIEVVDGRMKVVKKFRGGYKKCLCDYISERLEGRDDIRKDKVFITYTPVEDEEIIAVRETVSNLSGFEKVYETDAGCTISCHCGPGCLGILFIRK